MVFSGTNSRYLAEKICASLDCPLGKMNITHFADGEFAVSYEESIRGSHVFLVQSTFPNSDNLMELLLMVDAAKRASAKSVVAAPPVAIYRAHQSFQGRLEGRAEPCHLGFHQSVVNARDDADTEQGRDHGQDNLSRLLVVFHYQVEQGGIERHPRPRAGENEGELVEKQRVAAVHREEQLLI